MGGKILKALIAAAFIAGAGFYYIHHKKAQIVDVTHPVTGPAVEAVYATGTVEPTVMVPVSPRISARLMALQADEGQTVTKGQVLAQLEDEDLQKSLEEMEAERALAEKEYARKTALAEKGVAPKDAVDQATAALESAKAKVAKAQANISYMQLLAPEDGTVIRREGEVGELIPSGQPVFWLTCCSGLRISAEVDEEDIAQIKVGQKVLIHADAFPDDVFNGAVESITPKGDPVARSYRVRISLARDVPLMIGMTAESNIILREEQKALLLPVTAIKDDAVMLFKDGSFVRTPVDTGAKTATAVEIRKGVAVDDIILVDAAKAPADGAHPDVNDIAWKAE